ncbi:unnamed protein product [Mesocestoides corti]|uniref:ANK_REP_REGION domain-containing protein n=1 Tax=Mesocestoides corti TaxID=53468 RepID=A0A158QU95_MESCO|nr:unnamed protein product [Mesocestoides corti]
MNCTVNSTALCCRRLGEFIESAKRAVELHVKSVRLETYNSTLVELSKSVDKMADQEYADVMAGATSLITAFTRSIHGRRGSSVTTAKTRMSSVRSVCEGLRQGLSLISRTNTLLASEFGPYVPLPESPRRHSLMVISILIAASHIVNSGLLLLSQSDLSRYTHAELWDITRGMEELSNLTERVQEQLDEKKQFYLRRLLLDGCPHRNSTPSIEQRLSDLCILTDPIDSIRPASVGHIIYLLARYRSAKLAHTLAADLHQALKDPKEGLDFLTEAVRKEYEFCSNFLDVMTQSTELLRNLRKAQECAGGHTKSVPQKANSHVYIQHSNLKAHRKPALIAKTESIDNFISTFPDNPSKQIRPITSINEQDEEINESHQKKAVQWSDYYEVTLRHQVVGRYLQLTWIGFSEELDGAFQLVGLTFPSDPTMDSTPWPLRSRQEVRQLVSRLHEVGKCEGLPSLFKHGICRQAERLRIAADSHDWTDWSPSKWILDRNPANLLRTPLGRVFKNLLRELMKDTRFSVVELLKRLTVDARRCFDLLALKEEEDTIPQLEFSHRQLRSYLDQSFLSLELFLAEVLEEFCCLLKSSRSSLDTGPTIIEFAFRACLQIDHCLSLLELLRGALGYHESLIRPSDTSGSCDEYLNSRLQEDFITSCFDRVQKTAHNLKAGQAALQAGNSRFWANLASQQSFAMRQAVLNYKNANVVEVDCLCGNFIHIVERIYLLCFENTEANVSDVVKQDACFSELNAQLISSALQAILVCLEQGFLTTVEALSVSEMHSLQCLLAKMLVCIDQITAAQFVASDKPSLVSRCTALVVLLQPQRNELYVSNRPGNISQNTTDRNSASPVNRPKEVINRFHQYFSENVFTRFHSSATFSALGTLSTNVRAFFQHEDVVSRPVGPSADGHLKRTETD